MTSPSAERNKEPILGVLRQWIGAAPHVVLEVGSGTGQHAEHFARALPHVTWQTSDIGGYLRMVGARVDEAALPNLRAPIELNVNAFVDVPGVDVIYTANTLHIMSWESARAFLSEAGDRLPGGGLLLIYGPFNVGGRATSPSNAQFSHRLRSEDYSMGIRDREQVCFEADRAGLSLRKIHAMPANNQLLVFERRARPTD